jgi:hypothetical protein
MPIFVLEHMQGIKLQLEDWEYTQTWMITKDVNPWNSSIIMNP